MLLPSVSSVPELFQRRFLLTGYLLSGFKPNIVTDET